MAALVLASRAKDVRLRLAAAGGLAGAYPVALADGAKGIEPALRRLAGDPDVDVRRQVVSGLSAYDTPFVRELLEARLEDEGKIDASEGGTVGAKAKRALARMTAAGGPDPGGPIETLELAAHAKGEAPLGAIDDGKLVLRIAPNAERTGDYDAAIEFRDGFRIGGFGITPHAPLGRSKWTQRLGDDSEISVEVWARKLGDGRLRLRFRGFHRQAK